MLEYILFPEKKKLQRWKLQLHKSKIASINALMTTTALSKRAENTENEIPDITNLATKTAINTK